MQKLPIGIQQFENEENFNSIVFRIVENWRLPL